MLIELAVVFNSPIVRVDLRRSAGGPWWTKGLLGSFERVLQFVGSFVFPVWKLNCSAKKRNIWILNWRKEGEKEVEMFWAFQMDSWAIVCLLGSPFWPFLGLNPIETRMNDKHRNEWESRELVWVGNSREFKSQEQRKHCPKSRQRTFSRFQRLQFYPTKPEKISGLLKIKQMRGNFRWIPVLGFVGGRCPKVDEPQCFVSSKRDCGFKRPACWSS